jgi:hypothetical protein
LLSGVAAGPQEFPNAVCHFEVVPRIAGLAPAAKRWMETLARNTPTLTRLLCFGLDWGGPRTAPRQDGQSLFSHPANDAPAFQKSPIRRCFKPPPVGARGPWARANLGNRIQ